MRYIHVREVERYTTYRGLNELQACKRRHAIYEKEI